MADDKSVDSRSSKPVLSTMETKLSTKKYLKKRSIRRGYGKKNERKNKLNQMNLSIIGTNSAGLRGKMESFYNLINEYSPSIITIQETKHKKTGTIKMKGFQTFEKVRKNKGGGGLLTAVCDDLDPVLVSQGNEDIEIIVVEANLGIKKLRIINAYGPQEDDNIDDILNFWQELEGEVIKATEENCLILIELDANAKLGNGVLKGDPHKISNNGKVLLDIIERQNLIITNSLDICKGTITRERIFENKTEQSIIDYILVCQELAKDITEVTIDDERIHVLSRQTKTRTGIKTITSDHNILSCKFNIKFLKKSRVIRKELFNLKCEEGKKHFYEETNTTNTLSTCFSRSASFQQNSNKFFKNLMGTFHKCFKKIRIRSGKLKSYGEENIQGKLKLKLVLKRFLLNNISCKIATKLAKQKLEEIEESLAEATAAKNAHIVKDHVENIETIDGNFSQLGFWKLKKKLFPISEDPPMAKRDKDGNIISAPEGI